MNKYIAIDLGSSRISAMIAEVQQNGALKILAIESKKADDVKHGIVDQVSGAAFKINEVIKLAQNTARSAEPIEKVIVSTTVNGKSMKSHTVTVNRFVDASKIVSGTLLQEMHEEAGNKINGDNVAIYDIIPLSYELDGVNFDDPVGQKGTQISGKYNLIYGNSIIENNLKRCYERTGLNLESTFLSIEALSTAVLEEEDRESGCALINLGATTTTLGIYHAGVLQQLVVSPLGGKNITRDIMELGISEEHAEKIKIRRGSALVSMINEPVLIQVPSSDTDAQPVKISTEFLSTIIEARLDEITQPLFNAIKSSPIELKGGIIITGGGAKMHNIIEYINERTDIYARKGHHTDWLADGNDLQYSDPILSQLVGTIILQDEYRKENPIQVEEKTKKKQKDKGKGSRNITKIIQRSIFNFFSEDSEMK
ncbi:MAG: cell division protein FtsA [Paludibacteraceae bacterium]|nr:cell division protein FtsA [Paludibacteraceae bacterium]